MSKKLFRSRNNSKNQDISVIEMMRNQLSTLTIVFRTVSVFIVVLTIFLGIFSVLRIDSIERNLTTAIEKQDKNIINLSDDLQQRMKQMRDELIQQERDIDTKLDRLSEKVDNDVKYGIKDMEDKFDKFSGQALMIPKIEVLYNDLPINGKIITYPSRGSASTTQLSLKDIFIWNTGDKPVQGFTLIFFFSEDVNSPRINLYPLRKEGYKKAYAITYNSQTINPGYKWGGGEYSKDFIFYIYNNHEKLSIKCLIEVYYNNPEQEIAEFTINIEE